MKKSLYIISVIVFAVALISCGKSASPTFGNPGSYYKGEITFSDSIKSNVLTGIISLHQKNTESLTGEWEFDDGSNGKLNGSIHNNKITINLNPDMIDDNTYLNGVFEDGNISGQWVHSGVMGVNNYGSFFIVGY